MQDLSIIFLLIASLAVKVYDAADSLEQGEFVYNFRNMLLQLDLLQHISIIIAYMFCNVCHAKTNIRTHQDIGES